MVTKKKGVIGQEGGESHAKVVIVAGPGGTKEIMPQNLENFEERAHKSQVLLIIINTDQCRLCCFARPRSHFVNMPRNFSTTLPPASPL